LAGRDGGLHAMLGLHCVLFEFLGAALPLGLVLAASRRWTRAAPTVTAAVAAAGALAGQGALHLACPEHAALPHLLAFHSGAVLLAAFAGWLAGPRRPAAAGSA
jgi:hypothetical protein